MPKWLESIGSFFSQSQPSGNLSVGHMMSSDVKRDAHCFLGVPTYMVGAWVRSEKLPWVSANLLHITLCPNGWNQLFPLFSLSNQSSRPLSAWQMMSSDVRRTPIVSEVLTVRATTLSLTTLSLHHPMGALMEIRQISSAQPMKGLGVIQTTTADQTPEYEFRLTHCRTIAVQAASSILSLRESHNLMGTRILPKTTLSMPVTTFSNTQCGKLNTVIDEVMLPKYKLNRHTP